MKGLTDKYGQTNEVCEYLGRVKGHWHAVPTSSGTQIKGPCGRISLLKNLAGLDVTSLYPAKPAPGPGMHGWTYDAMLKAMEACRRAACRLASGSADHGLRPTPSARSSRPSAPSWSMARATSRSSPTRCARCWSTRRNW